MGEVLVTVVVLPHERFSPSLDTLDALLERTSTPFEFVYVDTGSPRHVHRALEARSREHGFRLLRTEEFLTANCARNLALDEVATPYVVYLDNDVWVSPGWLDALLGCAEETDAWAVAPLYCEGLPEGEIVHMAGGSLGIDDSGGRRECREKQLHNGRCVEEVRGLLRRERTESLEMHCLLLRTESLRALGGFDEALLTVSNLDISLEIQRAGGTIMLEPEAVVTYVRPPPLAWSDRRYFQWHWGRNATSETLDYLRQKWDLADDDPTLRRIDDFVERHRRKGLIPAPMARGRRRRVAERVLHTRRVKAFEAWLNERRFAAPEVFSARRGEARGSEPGR